MDQVKVEERGTNGKMKRFEQEVTEITEMNFLKKTPFSLFPPVDQKAVKRNKRREEI